jgi:hypothetical protein
MDTMGEWTVVYGWVGQKLQSDVYPNWNDASTGAEFELDRAVATREHFGETFIVAILNPRGMVTEARSYQPELPDDRHSLMDPEGD